MYLISNEYLALDVKMGMQMHDALVFSQNCPWPIKYHRGKMSGEGVRDKHGEEIHVGEWGPNRSCCPSRGGGGHPAPHLPASCAACSTRGSFPRRPWAQGIQ